MGRSRILFRTCVVTYILMMTCVSDVRSVELLQNGGFENSMAPWHCYNFLCELVPGEESRFGRHSIRTFHRQHTYEGPGQTIQAVPGNTYKAQSWVKLINDKQDMLGQTLEMEIGFAFSDGKSTWMNIAHQPLVTTSDGWILLEGDFQAPSTPFVKATFYYQGPDPSVDYAVDLASVTDITIQGSDWRNETDFNINKYRKSDVHFSVHAANGIDKSQVQIRVKQTKKSFPFGTAVNSWRYVDGGQQKYRDFIHQHFNWAVLENALKWTQLERNQGQLNFDRAMRTIHGLKGHGLKVRGHNMVWSVDQFIPHWVKPMSGDHLRQTVRHHIQWTLNLTRGLLEHWDVNNENLHGQWYQNRLNDRDYDLELFREMHQIDPHPKLFLNDYSVVGSGAATGAYRKQGQRFKDAGVHLYGMGVQTHFSRGVEPNPVLIKQRLDTLASVGVPLWTTELDVQANDENTRADWYERVLRALYGHPAIEGIVFWGFWGDIQSAGQAGALVTGPNLSMTAAGRRVLDLFENQWMTDQSHVLSQSGDHFTVRGFHGDYEIHIMYHGRELSHLRKTFTLGKSDTSVNLNVHT